MENKRNANTFANVTKRGYLQFSAPSDCRWVTDFIGESWRFWPKGSWIFLDCPTYSGKTTFVKNLTQVVTLKALILTNRRANRDQILADLGFCGMLNFSNFDVKSYQSVELDVSYTPEYLDNYDFIMCDEAHYFYASSLLSPRVNLMLEKLFATQHAIKLFMSATNAQIFEFVKRRLHSRYGNFEASRKLQRYILKGSNLNFDEILKFDSVDDIIHEIQNTEFRWLVFADSIASGKDLAKKIGNDAFFLDSESAESDPKAKKVYDELIKMEKFTPRVLVTTPLLDNGVNIKDRSLKGIVITSDSSIELVQMAGRKRSLDKEDQCSIYLSVPKRQKICGRQHKLLQQKALFLKFQTQLSYTRRPDPVHMENTATGHAYRQAVFYDHVTGRYGFNWIGLIYINDAVRELETLKNAEDIFEVKKGWLLGSEPPILKRLPQPSMQETKVQRLMEVLYPYRGQKILMRSEEWKVFSNKFTTTYWEIFGIDKKNNHRRTRQLSFQKINAALTKHGIPAHLEKITVNDKSAAVLLFSAARKLK